MRALCIAGAALSLTGLLWAQEPEPIGPELLTNGGFEQVAAEGELPQGWRGFASSDWGECAGSVRLSGLESREGDHCLEMSGVRTQYAAVHSERTEVHSAKTYVLSGWTRTELARGQSAYLVASWFGENGWLALSQSRGLRGVSPWTRVSVVLAAEGRPEGARSCQVSFRISGSSARGRAWVDDMSLRECQAAAPESRVEAEQARLLEMARELMVEREAWRERLGVLERRRADLEQLLGETGSAEELMRRHGEAVRQRSFLTHVARPRAELESAVPEEASEIRVGVGVLRELPALREQCYRELEAMLQLKRQLDARPELRRCYLWAQLGAMRLQPARPPQPERTPRPTAEYQQALLEPPQEASGDLLDVEVRPRLDEAGSGGVVRFGASVLRPGAGASVQAGLFSPGGDLVAFRAAPLNGNEARLEMEVPAPNLWFPDYPYLYTLRAGLFRDGEAVDWVEQRVAFRQVRVAEGDVTATMRHAWGWSLADYAFTINGQPYLPRGTVCGEARRHPDEAQELFSELWLDYNRSYGSFLARLSAAEADDLAVRGLTQVGALGPDYRGIRSYVSSRQGLEDYRETARHCRWLADHPAVLAIEVGNEAELSAWGADLQSVYGRDLWHVFNEVVRCLREEMEPAVPVAYVRAGSFRQVLPVPREDYSGVNQYTGRYSGRRCTMSSELGKLAQAATLDDKPMGITEWNGPKYSWATRGVSGVEEEGAAQYVFDYYRTMLRTPAVVLSTEFVLNWIATPLEDLTTVPLTEGLRRREQWSWSMQKGVPWYPAIWPDLLTDTQVRRAMRGFQSPLYELCEAPGEVLVAAASGQETAAERLAQALAALGKRARAATMPDAQGLAQTDANLLLIGGPGAEQPPAIRELEDMGVIGRTTEGFPPAGECLIQRRVNPHFPDRFLVTVTAADEAGMRGAIERLAASAEGLRQAYGRHASCRRALALVDENEEVARVFSRYVLELPTRSLFLGRDDIRTRLSASELLNDDGTLAAGWEDLGAVIVAARRELSEEEREVLRALPPAGVNVIWSGGTLEANPEVAVLLEVSLGQTHALSDHLPVAGWAQEPLAVPEIGEVAADRVEQFGGLEPGTEQWDRAMNARELEVGQGWRAAASTEAGAPIVAVRAEGEGSHWVFGVDLEAAAVALHRTTSGGAIHAIYDRDTACGLERPFRLVANAAAFGAPARAADTPRLRAEIVTDRETYERGETIRVRVLTRDAQGEPCDAKVRVSLGDGSRLLGLPGEGVRWVEARRMGPGRYEAQAMLSEEPTEDSPVADISRQDHRGQRIITIFADVTRPGWVSDWTAHIVRAGTETDERGQMEHLARLVEEDLVETLAGVRDREQWVELDAALVFPARMRAGQPAELELAITRVEDDRGNDWLEEVELLLRRAEGEETVRLPVAPGKCISAARASVVEKRPDDTMVVDSARPAQFRLQWGEPKAGLWSAWLRYRYSDDYHIQDTNRLLREDAFGGAVFEVSEGQ